MPSDFAIHSDVLVYWTGAKDIETGLSNPADRTKAYLDRLTNILRYGLWMTDQPPPDFESAIKLEAVPCTCFTELKLSESSNHSREYGRLGVAFKRPFLFARGGRPMVYYGTTDGMWVKKDRFLHACANDLKDKRLMHFFKPMNSSPKLTYDLYSESEWRIVFDEARLKDGSIVDPRVPNTPANAYFTTLSKDQQNKLRFLVPVDGWLSLIIYPSIEAKNAAQTPGSAVESELVRIKSNPLDHANRVEHGNFPVELDLDLCRHL